MRIVAWALVAILALAPGIALAQAMPDTGNIRYFFPTLLVPDKPVDRERTVGKNDTWFAGKAFPVRAMALDSDLGVADPQFTLPRGTILTVANADRLIACQRDVVVTAGVGGMGRSPVCLVDLDRDGKFDGWFKSSITLVWGCCNGHLERSHIRPIAPITATPLSPGKLRSLEPWGYFSIRNVRGMLTWCLGLSDVCLQKAPRIKPSATEQTTEFMGGLFGYRKLEDGRLTVRMIRDPQEGIY